jgi:dipeptidyl aminopeptidase/acylaminoacyl peptidase
MLELAFAYTRIRYGVNLTNAQPATALAASKVPALLIEDEADRNIPIRHAALIMRAARGQIEMWNVAGSDHGGASRVQPDEFKRKVLDWFQSHRTLEVSGFEHVRERSMPIPLK